MMNAQIEGQWTGEDVPLTPGRNGAPHRTRPGAVAAVTTVPAELPDSLPADQLRWMCDPGVFQFETTRDVQPIAWIIGQGPAADALRFGLETRAGRRPRSEGSLLALAMKQAREYWVRASQAPERANQAPAGERRGHTGNEMGDNHEVGVCQEVD